jgi:death on curing protein
VSKPVWLLETAVLIAHEISLANHGGSAGLRDHGLLQSALARPRNLYEYGKPGLPELAAAYMAGIIKNHPFVDGNKRAGFLAGAAFLELNGLRLVATEPEATQVVLGLASGEITEAQLSDWLQRNSTSGLT